MTTQQSSTITESIADNGNAESPLDKMLAEGEGFLSQINEFSQEMQAPNSGDEGPECLTTLNAEIEEASIALHEEYVDGAITHRCRKAAQTAVPAAKHPTAVRRSARLRTQLSN